ncbi:MAG TPA: OmpA family protein [Chitinophagaceae bacterium]|nr:OmpA family protein [Chitinophagaceae bacterium]
MSKLFFFIAILLASSQVSHSQFGGLMNKVKNKVQQRADKKVDDQIDKGLDKAEGKNTTPAPTYPAAANADASATAAPANTLKSFSKYDFLPGDSILYAEDFAQEEIGELPANWNTSGTGEVTTLDKFPGQWLRLHKQFVYLTANKKEFRENYTMEFDVILQLKNNGWMFPEFNVGIFASGDQPNTDNEFLKEYNKNAAVVARLLPGGNNDSKVSLASWLEKNSYYTSDIKAYESLNKSYGLPVHIAIQVQKERFRMWVNEDKVFDAPKAIPTGVIMNQLLFNVSHTNYPEDQYAVFIGNIKVATGKPDTRHKLLDEGKFSTTGILFDFQSAVIKPESYGVVKEIAGVIKENGSLKVKVIGHTSSDGDDKANMELSKKRAAAVKDILTTEFGVDAARLETEGKGETQPIADNKTKEGKAANRRVEFIKL